MALQFTIPRRRKVQKSGISHGPKRNWPRHCRFVRSHYCSVPGCECSQIECCHWRSAANAGTAQKPPDWFTLPLCFAHHREQHEIGQTAFEKRYGIVMREIAAEMARRSPDVEMRAEMRLAA